MSNNVAEQFASANKAVMENFFTAANTALATAERLAALNLNTARSVLEEGVKNSKSLLSVKDVQELAALQPSLSQPGVERVMSYSRSVIDIATESQKQFASLVEAQLGGLQTQVLQLVEQATKNSPTGSEAVVNAVKTAFAQANSVIETVSKAIQPKA
jgi:phasin family protein